MRRTVLMLAACALALFLPGAGGGVASGPPPRGAATGETARSDEPVVMNHWEAKAAGFHVSPLPSETGIRPCTEADYGPGFTSAAAAEKAAQEYDARWGEQGPGYCQEDPRTMTYMILPGRPFSPLGPLKPLGDEPEGG